MIRKIIVIDREKCNGCGLCASACAEGAIAMVDGKAELIRDDYCDGLGNCLPACPTGAISFEEREAAAYDEEAVKHHLESREAERAAEASRQEEPLACGCPGSMSRSIQRGEVGKIAPAAGRPAAPEPASELRQWPVQIQLAPVTAPYFQNANLLVAADCTAYARGDFHSRFIRGRVVLVGCPKLDPVDYTEKLTEIIRRNEIKSVTVVRMEVPCCGGLERAVKNALMASGKFLPWQVVTISVNGEILE